MKATPGEPGSIRVVRPTRIGTESRGPLVALDQDPRPGARVYERKGPAGRFLLTGERAEFPRFLLEERAEKVARQTSPPTRGKGLDYESRDQRSRAGSVDDRVDLTRDDLEPGRVGATRAASTRTQDHDLECVAQERAPVVDVTRAPAVAVRRRRGLTGGA